MDWTNLLFSGSAAALLFALVYWILLKSQVTPQERERRRRLAINRSGRMADGHIIEVNGDTICYSYAVSGVEYLATQDISTFSSAAAIEPGAMVGHITVKYAQSNPADSILMCEEWSGAPLRSVPSRTATEAS